MVSNNNNDNTRQPIETSATPTARRRHGRYHVHKKYAKCFLTITSKDVNKLASDLALSISE